MTTATLYLKSPSLSSWKRWTRRTVIGTSIAIVAIILTTILATVADVGLGGLISEKMLGRTGEADSSLLLGRTGTNTTLSIMGFAPVTSTQVAIGSGDAVPTALLQGIVSNMNGMPVATGYFQWGLAAGALVNTTPNIAITTTGSYSATITGFPKSDRVYYRFVTDADGTAYGAVADFVIPSGTGNYLLKNLLRVILAAVICITVLKMSRNMMSMLLLSLIGIIAFAIISTIIDTML